MMKACRGGHAFGKSHCCDEAYIDVGVPKNKEQYFFNNLLN